MASKQQVEMGLYMRGRVENVFCFQGVNNRISKLINRLSTNEQAEVFRLVKEAAIILDFELAYSSIHITRVDALMNDFVLTYITDYVVFNSLIKRGTKADVLVGYSLGLNTALVCGGYLDFYDGLRIFKCIKKCLCHSIENRNDDMALIIGLDYKTVDKLINSLNAINEVSIACENSEENILIAGDCDWIKSICDKATEMGALKAFSLDTSLAFHREVKENWLMDAIKGMDEIIVESGNIDVLSVYTLDFLENRKSSVIEELNKKPYLSDAKAGLLILV